MIGLRSRNKILVGGALALWFAAVAGGYCWLTDYSLKAGTMSERNPAQNFGEEVGSLLAPGGPTLFVALHPECSCSVSTAVEMQRISDACGGQLRMVAIFSDYETLPVAADQSKLWQKVISVPGASAMVDRDGSLQRALGAETSGECFLIGEDGLQLYHGGITSARGHEGPSRGGDAIIESVRDHVSGIQQAPVFGCGLDEG